MGYALRRQVETEIETLEELAGHLEARMCETLRESIERLKRKPSYPLLKPFIRRTLGELLDSCGIEL